MDGRVNEIAYIIYETALKRRNEAYKRSLQYIERNSMMTQTYYETQDQSIQAQGRKEEVAIQTKPLKLLCTNCDLVEVQDQLYIELDEKGKLKHIKKEEKPPLAVKGSFNI